MCLSQVLFSLRGQGSHIPDYGGRQIFVQIPSLSLFFVIWQIMLNTEILSLSFILTKVAGLLELLTTKYRKITPHNTWS